MTGMDYTLSTGLVVPVPLVLMKYSRSAFLLTRSTASVTLDRDWCMCVCTCVTIQSCYVIHSKTLRLECACIRVCNV